ncbi:MAG: TrkH family potassium uptake protein [Ruminococcaceae bacterium]|nr:TrkH family potassium uptake protein [Oscillospiraceae bacterium]
MNFRIINYILGWVLIIEAAFLLMPFFVGLYCGESSATAFLIGAAISAAVGTLFVIKKPKDTVFFIKEGFVAVALSWIALSTFGALPFVISGEIPKFIDALFETVSGFTTTGSSILSDVEALSHASLFWRSFTHWIGGMGVLVFLLAVLPMAGGSQMHLMRAESPGPSVSKLVPKTQYTAIILYGIYILLTIIQFILLIIGGMPIFDAITITFGTAGTGGFGIKNDSIASYSPYCQWIIAAFMVIFGVNFNVYFLMLLKRFKQAISGEEFRTYLGLVAGSTALIAYNIYKNCNMVEGTLRHAFFQVASIMTTTGFASTDYEIWPSFSHVILVLLMFIGASAGSTGGGIKVSRIILLAKRARQEIRHYFHPKRVTKIHLDGKVVESEVIKTTSAYLITYVLLFAASVLLISLNTADTTTAFTAVAATINNIGPGLAQVGPTDNFGFFNAFSKSVLIFDMLVGRLELFPMLILFNPNVWFSKRIKKNI